MGFSRGYKKRGVEHLSTYLKTWDIGGIVDVKGCGAFQKGMPHKAFHGKTGRVFNVSKRALGVVVNKRVRGKILPKRIYVGVEHAKHSQCRKDFLDRAHANEVKKKEAKTTGKKGAPCKRLPAPPKEAHLVSTKDNEPQVLGPIPFEFMA